jgi:uncharacterized protein YbjQ (UPF0145 family)
MKHSKVAILSILMTLIAGTASARNTIHQFSIAEFMENSSHSSRLQGVGFYFGDQPHPAVSQSFGEYRTNKKTNAFNKDDKEACEWVFLSALLSLYERAQSLGANAVVNIRSNYKNNVVSSATEYTCGAGGLMAGVALIGDFVVIEADK